MNATLSLRRTIRISNGSPARKTITVDAGLAGAMSVTGSSRNYLFNPQTLCNLCFMIERKDAMVFAR